MGPLETWLFIGTMAALLFLAFEGAGRFVDLLLDRLFTSTDNRLWVGTDDKEES